MGSYSAPIWKDTPIPINGGTSANDFIVGAIPQGILFRGNVGAGTHDVVINDIVAPLLSNPFPRTYPSGGGFVPYTATITAGIEVGNVPQHTFIPWLDWSYNPTRTIGSVKSEPITGKMDERQPLIYTKATESLTSLPFYRWNEYGYRSTLKTLSGSVGFANVIAEPTQFGYAEYAPADTAFGDKRWKVTCGNRYALYYLNKFGGWDWLLIEGENKPFETYTGHDARLSFLNPSNNPQNAVRWGNEIQRSWRLVTGWLKDEENARMSQLLGSPDVWLMDLEDGATPAERLANAVPVIITDTQWEGRTYKADGLTRWEINVKDTTIRYR